MATLNPYLNFEGNCREAMNFYKACLGGTLELMTVGEMPAMTAQMPPEMKDSIMHSSLRADGIVLMASDLNRNKPNEGNTYELCLVCNDEEETNTLFNKLAKGGKITEALQPMPWGDLYGSLTDMFGKRWLFDCPLKKM